MPPILDQDALAEEISAGYVSTRKHPHMNLWIYNYTPKAQYDRRWNDITRQCRGLILNGNMDVIARPFPKFFNLDEHKRSDIVFSKPFVMTPKLDGSLGIMYRGGFGKPAIATRGSFESDQAKWATRWVQEKHGGLAVPEGITLLFEIIYPENRIVVNYGNQRGLYLLAAIDNATGEDLPHDYAQSLWSGESVDLHEPEGIRPRDIKDNIGATDGTEEGWVLHFNWPKEGPRTRIKVKHSEYVRLHRVVTSLNARAIWDMLRTGTGIEELLSMVPDEYYPWVRHTSTEMQNRYDFIMQHATHYYNEHHAHAVRNSSDEILPILDDHGVETIDHLPEEAQRTAERIRKKAFARRVNDYLTTDGDHRVYKSLMFMMWDDKDPVEMSELIWQHLYPPHLTPVLSPTDHIEEIPEGENFEAAPIPDTNEWIEEEQTSVG